MPLREISNSTINYSEYVQELFGKAETDLRGIVKLTI